MLFWTLEILLLNFLLSVDLTSHFHTFYVHWFNLFYSSLRWLSRQSLLPILGKDTLARLLLAEDSTTTTLAVRFANHQRLEPESMETEYRNVFGITGRQIRGALAPTEYWPKSRDNFSRKHARMATLRLALHLFPVAPMCRGRSSNLCPLLWEPASGSGCCSSGSWSSVCRLPLQPAGNISLSRLGCNLFRPFWSGEIA